MEGFKLFLGVFPIKKLGVWNLKSKYMMFDKCGGHDKKFQKVL